MLNDLFGDAASITSDPARIEAYRGVETPRDNGHGLFSAVTCPELSRSNDDVYCSPWVAWHGA